MESESDSEYFSFDNNDTDIESNYNKDFDCNTLALIVLLFLAGVISIAYILHQ
jgi:hypothetical protein